MHKKTLAILSVITAITAWPVFSEAGLFGKSAKTIISEQMPKYDRDFVEILNFEKVHNYKDCYKFTAKVTSSAMRVGGVPVQDYVVKLQNNKISKGTYITGGLLESTAELVCR